jgi:predicted hydrocarbon binding protein
MLVRIARQLVRNSYQGSRAIATVRGGTARIDVRASIFCSVREPVDHPLCGFYAAAFTRLLTLFNLRTRAEVLACRGTGKPGCVMSMALSNGSPEAGGHS